MLRRRVDLPMASGGKSPTPPRRQLNMPDATPSNVLSFTWVLFSLALVGVGYLHCSSHSEQSRLRCVEDICTFSRDSPASQSSLEYQFLRENLVSASVAQLDKNGKVVQGGSGKRPSRRQKRGMSQTYTVTWQDAESKVKTTLPITEFNLGKRTPRAKVALITQYVKKQTNTLDVREGRWFTGIGIVCFVFGTLLLIMRVAIGPLVSEVPSRRAYAKKRLFK